MPRKRSIKPDFNGDEDIAALSPWARLFYIGLWGQMDRNGLIEDNPRLLRARIFPLDEQHTTAYIAELRDELLKSGPSGRSRLVRVIHMGKTLLFCPTLSTHQKIYADEPAVFDVPREVLEAIREKLKKAQPYQGDSAPQPGTVPGPGPVECREPALSRASASPSASPLTSTSTPASASPSAGLSRIGDKSGATADEDDPVIKVIDGVIKLGSKDSARGLIMKLPVSMRERYSDWLRENPEQRAAGGSA